MNRSGPLQKSRRHRATPGQGAGRRLEPAVACADRPLRRRLLGGLVVLLATASMPALGGQGELPPGVSVTTSVETQSPLLRQEILVTLELQDSRRGITRFEIHRPEGSGIVARYLDHDRARVTVDRVAVDRRLYRWAVMPTYPGPVEIAFSEMTMRSTAAPGETFSYTPEPVTVEVRPLAGYLPTSLPVGRPVLVADDRPAQVAPDIPASRVLRIEGPGLAGIDFGPLLAQQLVDRPGQAFYAPQTNPLDEYDPQRPLISRLEIRLPFIARGESPGETVDWPALRLPYVDPQTGQLAALEIPSQQTRVVLPPVPPSPWWWLLGFPIALFLGLLGRDIEARLNRRAAQRRLRRRLEQANDIAALYRTLLDETGCGTLAALKRRAPNPEWCRTLDALESARFGRRPQDHDRALHEELLRWLPRLF